MQPFEKLVPELTSIIRRISCRYICNEADIEDIVQDVLLKLIASKESIQVNSVKAWTAVIARNTAIDSLREKRRAGRYEDIHASARLNKLANSELTPFQIADEEQDFDSTCGLAIALQALPVPQRSVLALCDLANYFSQIGELFFKVL